MPSVSHPARVIDSLFVQEMRCMILSGRKKAMNGLQFVSFLVAQRVVTALRSHFDPPQHPPRPLSHTDSCIHGSSTSSGPLTMAFMNHPWLAGQFPALMGQPVGVYGISYDIYTRPSEDPVPNGWESHRSDTYRELISMLRFAGFIHHQYSDHRNMNITAWDAYNSMIALVYIEPPSKLATTVKGLKMHYISDMNLMDVTNQVMLGGNAAQCLGGPTPRALVHRLVGPGLHLTQVPQPVPQGHPGVPPRHTSLSPGSMNPANYLM